MGIRAGSRAITRDHLLEAYELLQAQFKSGENHHATARSKSGPAGFGKEDEDLAALLNGKRGSKAA